MLDGRIPRAAALLLLALWFGATASAQDPARHADPAPETATDPRAQYPPFLVNSYFSLETGYLNYPFSTNQLAPGFQTASIKVPHVAAGVVLVGHQVRPHLSIELTYLRPIKYVRYENVDHTGLSDSVWMAFGMLTAKSQMTLTRRLSLTGHAGIALTNRTGFMVGTRPVVADEHFMSGVVGVGLELHANAVWDFVSGLTLVPANHKHDQPYALFGSAGVRFVLRPLTAERVEEKSHAHFMFPLHVIEASYSTNSAGYGLNDFMTGKLHIFWAGHVSIARGVELRYERDVFHTRRVFALDLGLAVAHLRSLQNADGETVISAYPALHFTVVRSRVGDVDLTYSFAGPSFLSRNVLDGVTTGATGFTFRDAMGASLRVGHLKRVTVGIEISHFSNGNLFGKNPGITVPLTWRIGYAF